jgi:amino acid transporter
MLLGRNLLRATIASALVAIPLAFASSTVVQVDGDWSDLISHPGFWLFYGRVCAWFFLAGILASVLTMFLMSKDFPQKS